MQKHKGTIDPAGRVLIPAEWRNTLGLRPGTEVTLVQHPGSVEVMSRQEALKRVQVFAAGLKQRKESVVDELIREREEEARREYGD